MELWLSNGNSDKVQLPINPESIGSQFTQNFEDIVLANGDEKTILSGSNLKTTTISSFFTANQTYFQEVYNVLTPFEYVEKIEGWMKNRKVLLFQVTGTNINRNVTIRSFDWEESGGSVGDINYTLELKEFLPVTYKVIDTKTANNKVKVEDKSKNTTPSTKRPPSNSNKPGTYTVKKGDSLWKISKQMYGNGANWNQIYSANKNVVGKNPNLIYPGQKLVIPWN